MKKLQTLFLGLLSFVCINAHSDGCSSTKVGYPGANLNGEFSSYQETGFVVNASKKTISLQGDTLIVSVSPNGGAADEVVASWVQDHPIVSLQQYDVDLAGNPVGIHIAVSVGLSNFLSDSHGSYAQIQLSADQLKMLDPKLPVTVWIFTDHVAGATALNQLALQ